MNPSVHERVIPKGIRLSDHIEDQPLSRFCTGRLQSLSGAMCGLALVADFLGINWSKVSGLEENNLRAVRSVESFIIEKLGRPVPFSWKTFDSLSWISPDHDLDLQRSKDYLVKSLRDAGL